jgi:hypothetical protein
MHVHHVYGLILGQIEYLKARVPGVLNYLLPINENLSTKIVD